MAGEGEGTAAGASHDGVRHVETAPDGRSTALGKGPAGGGGLCSCDYDGDEDRPDCKPGVRRPRCWCHNAWSEGPHRDCGGETRTLNGETEPGGKMDGLKALLDTAWCGGAMFTYMFTSVDPRSDKR